MSNIPASPEAGAPDNKFNLRVWDAGLVVQELERNHLLPRDLTGSPTIRAMGVITPATKPKNRIKEGTFSGTAKAMTEVYHRIQMRRVLLGCLRDTAADE
ncbi:hypothetical protein NliqN6_2316 [Naganishia liquefaciens]|uniref:Uncharacterized protein n=1 Tax=Naganishia liquefaciens TaxID=104408 RepID=A0A8H3YE03_9TREE|nr:hypothetical protein NliqN6_2316 [Naganishia liquefaciens]